MYVWLPLLILIISLISLLVAVFFKWQYQMRERLFARQDTWERTQDIRHQKWREYQHRRLAQLEQRILAQITQVEQRIGPTTVQNSAPSPEARQTTQIPAAPTPSLPRPVPPPRSYLIQESIGDRRTPLSIDAILAQVPRIEDMPLPDARDASRAPLPLAGRDLSERDLSYRSLRHADLRKARLVGSNLFMADLAGANLAGADLSHADLSAANLTDANLSGANLTGTNFLVADLNNARLTATHLIKARNLTPEQIRTARPEHPTVKLIQNAK